MSGPTHVTSGRFLWFTRRTPRTEVVLRLTVLVALIALAGCRDLTGPSVHSTPAPINPTSPIALSTMVSSAELALGDSVMITVTLTNVSDTTVTLNLSACSSPFVVTTRSGRAVGPDVADAVCPAVLIVDRLAPSESVSIPRTWDGTLVPPFNEHQPVFPGDYLVRGSGVYGPVRSNPAVELRILP